MKFIKFIKIVFFTLYYYLVGILDTLLTSGVIVFVKLTVWNPNKKYRLIFNTLIPNWAKRMVFHTGTQVNVEGNENIRAGQNYLILVNHQSNFDIYLVLGFIRLSLCFISKQFYFQIPFIGGLMKEMDCIPIKRSSPKASLHSLKIAAQKYDQGKSIIIYPEGTRSTDGKIKPFKKGFLHIIEHLAHGAQLLPITLSGSKNIQTKGEIKINPCQVLITIAPAITLAPEEIRLVEDKNQWVQKIEQIIKQSYRPSLNEIK